MAAIPPILAPHPVSGAGDAEEQPDTPNLRSRVAAFTAEKVKDARERLVGALGGGGEDEGDRPARGDMPQGPAADGAACGRSDRDRDGPARVPPPALAGRGPRATGAEVETSTLSSAAAPARRGDNDDDAPAPGLEADSEPGWPGGPAPAPSPLARL